MSDTHAIMTLSHAAIFRVLRSLIASELSGAERSLAPHLWQADTTLVDSGGNTSLGLDSFEFVSLATSVTRFFQLQDSGLEDYLLRYRTLGEWCEVVVTARENGARHIAPVSSGTMGDPKISVHNWDILTQEVMFFADCFEQTLAHGVKRVLVPCPVHHIYGFLFGVLLPEYRQLPVVDGLDALGKIQTGRLHAGDVVVGFPFLWQRLATQSIAIAPGVLGLTSTGPSSSGLFTRLHNQGLQHMVEIFGATETAGIGYRQQQETPFTLLPRWQRGETDNRLWDITAAKDVALQDNLCWQSDNHFTPAGRLDQAVQVGGINVYPEQIAERLCELPEVAAAQVRLMDNSEGQRLKAFVVPASPGQSTAHLYDLLHAWCVQHLATAEIPKHFTFGHKLPRNTMGKLQDWTPEPHHEQPQTAI